jgi:transcriptional regulator with XRE-family HTH domain
MVLLPYKHMSKIKEREQALSLRKAGSSIADIAKKLKVSKSTVSYWCRDVVLSKQACEKIVRISTRKSTAGILRYTEGLRQKRIAETSDDMEYGAKLIGKISSRDVMCVGLGLYWGEGYKKGSQEFGFTNSDVAMVLFYMQWLEMGFGVKKSDLIVRVSINESHRARVKEVESYWSTKTGVRPNQFTKTSLIKSASKKIYANQFDHYGTLRIKVRRGTRLRRRVLGAIQHLSQLKAE